MARTLAFGEIMMRLATPGQQRIIQATQFDVTYAGAEASVAVSLAQYGHQASYVTALPIGPIGDAAVSAVRYYGVDTSHVVRSKAGRMGVYFLESGASQRPSKVVYDRAYSTIAETPASAYDWPQLLAGQQSFHTTGITPALSRSCAEATANGLAAARAQGVLTSFDLNYRAKLWTSAAAQATIERMLANIDLLIANEEDAEKVLGIRAAKTDVAHGELDLAAYEDVARQIHAKYGIPRVAITLRESESASINHWSGCLLFENRFYLSRRYRIHIVDRVGAGDAFCGGLLHGILTGETPARTLEFAVAASCLKHTIPGDFNKVTAEEVWSLAGGDASGRVVR